jgi:hypothetical protein
MRSALLQSNPIFPITIHIHVVFAEMGSIIQAKERQAGLASSRVLMYVVGMEITIETPACKRGMPT